MSFFKNLFSKDEPFVPTPTQEVSGLEPIIVQAVENVFPNIDDQKEIFEVLSKNRKNSTVLIILSLLSLKTENVKDCKKWLQDNTSTPRTDTHDTFYHLAMDSGFHSIKDAEKWVKSITKSRA